MMYVNRGRVYARNVITKRQIIKTYALKDISHSRGDRVALAPARRAVDEVKYATVAAGRQLGRRK